MNCPAERTISFWRTLSCPLYLLIFLYFFFISAELLGLKMGVFKFKLNLLFGILLFLSFFLNFRVMRFDRDFLTVTLCCLGSMALSAIFGYHWLVSLGFFCYFIFNYLVYFVLPVNLFRFFDPRFVLYLYFLSFIPVGIFASVQVFGSIFSQALPGVTQYIGSLNRGQGFSYEPSFYALYMTPFAMFYTARFFLQEKNKRSVKKLIGSNFLLLVSTSTGCFFSYLAFLFCLGLMILSQVIRNTSFFKIFGKVFLTVAALFSLVWVIDPHLISQGFLKLFWAGIIHHHTFIARWVWICEYWIIFLENPILGTGLGGASAYYAQKNGIQIALSDPDIMEVGMAMNVTTEVLGSLGLLGVAAFGYFFFTIWKNCRKTLCLTLTPEERVDILSLIISLCVMFFTLQFSQSIMRPYTWLHVGICVGYMKYLQAKYRICL